MTRDLGARADGMAAQGVTPVARESTGVSWKPIYNLLEDRFQGLRVKARHLKQVPGARAPSGIAQGSRNGCNRGG